MSFDMKCPRSKKPDSLYFQKSLHFIPQYQLKHQCLLEKNIYPGDPNN